MARKRRLPCVIQSHSTTWHDGATAMLLPDGKIYSLASERVGLRQRHNWDSRFAYEYLRSRLPKYQHCFGSKTDFFIGADKGDFSTCRHHLYHAASTFYGSPFSEAAILIVDGQGPEQGFRVATTIWDGSRHDIKLVETPYRSRGRFIPQSLGHFYTAIGALAGMKNLHEEGKTMGLASYGKPSVFLGYFRQYAYSREDGSYFIDSSFISAVLGHTFGPRFYGWKKPFPELRRIWREILALRKSPMREADADVTQDDMDIAFAGQTILEELILGLARRARVLTKKQCLCLAGGVALNCAANSKVTDSGLFKDVYIFPAAEDSGQAVGKLFRYIHEHQLGVDTKVGNVYLGPEYTAAEIYRAIKESGFAVQSAVLGKTTAMAAKYLSDGQVLGWWQGRSEIGPRALGNRSILADPRRREMRDYINSMVKHREWYRPVAPAVLEESASEYFTLSKPSPFMLLVAKVRSDKAKRIPAVVHIDGTARVQTVNRRQNKRFYDLIGQFQRITGIPLIVNTSFNPRGEPIVETPAHALDSFRRMRLDALVIDKFLVVK